MLLKAVKLDNTEKVLELLQSPQDLNQVETRTGNSLIHFAIINQNQVILKELLTSKLGITPINLNITNNKDGTFILMIENSSGNPPLVSALDLNFLEGVQLLLQNKADINYPLQDGSSVIHHAVLKNTPQILRILISHGAKYNTLASSGSPLHLAISAGQIENGLFLLQLEDIQFEGVDDEGDSVFHLCAYEGAGDILNAIIKLVQSDKSKYPQVGRIVNLLNREGNSCLHVAAMNERAMIIQLLTNNQEDLDLNIGIKNRAGLTYLQIVGDIQKKREVEKDELRQRKKDVQEEKINRQHQRKQEVIEKIQKEEDYINHAQKYNEEAEIKQQKSEQFKKYYAILFFIILFGVFYLLLTIEIKGKKSSLLE